MTTAGQEKALSLFGDDAADDTECPICLDKLPPASWDTGNRVLLVCCGNFLCLECDADLDHKVHDARARIEVPGQDDARLQSLSIELETLSKCPLCREDRTKDPFNLLLRRAKAGMKWAQFQVAMAYKRGDLVEVDLSKSIYWHKEAAEQGVVASMYHYASFLEDKGCKKSKTKAFRWMKKAADAGFPPAQYDLCRFYDEGIGIGEDKEKMIELLKECAEQGLVCAQVHLGRLYMDGDGVEENTEKAIPLLKAACEKEVPVAQYLLAMCYRRNEMFDQYMEWLQKSANNDYPEALFALGHFLCAIGDKCGVSGAKLIRKAAALGHEEATKRMVLIDEKYSSECIQCKKKKPKDANLLKCSKCKLARYCSKVCQKRHWKASHKEECSKETTDTRIVRSTRI